MGRPAYLKTQIKRYFSVAVFFAGFSAVLMMLIPLVDILGTERHTLDTYIVAASFWISIVLELWMVHRCSAERKWMERKKCRHRSHTRARAGVLSFHKTRAGTITDHVMLLTAVAVAVVVGIRARSQWLIVGCASMLYLSINLHCLLNGKNYRYIQIAFSKFTKEHEQDE